MTDLVLVVATLAFIALCVAYVGWCDRIIGDDPTPALDDVMDAATSSMTASEAAASRAATSSSPLRAGSGVS
jgi:hypothetical protein